MEVEYLPKAIDDLNYWVKTNNKPVLKKIAGLTKAIISNPYEGLGKPEQLKYELSGKWSRRITREHRYIYVIEDDTLVVYSVNGHYI